MTFKIPIISILALISNIFAQGYDTAYVPVKVNAAATLTIELPDTAPSGAKIVEPSNGTVTVQANTLTTLTLIPPTVAVFAVVEKPSTSIANSDVQNVNATNAVLSWNLHPNVTKYEVYRNGELL